MVVIAVLAVQLDLSIRLSNWALAIILSNKALQTGVAKALQKTLKDFNDKIRLELGQLIVYRGGLLNYGLKLTQNETIEKE